MSGSPKELTMLRNVEWDEEANYDSYCENDMNTASENFGKEISQQPLPTPPKKQKRNILSYQQHESAENNNIERTIINYGKISQFDEGFGIDLLQSSRTWTKKNTCPYCFLEVTHFPRHLERTHKNEVAVKEIIALPPKHHKRKVLIDTIRRQGNFSLYNQENKIRPIKRPRINDQEVEYVICDFCLGFYKRNYLRRHRKKCDLKCDENSKRANHLSQSQIFTICEGVNKKFYDSLRLKNEVFTFMRKDEISKTAMNDVLICSYGESELSKHKRVQIRTVISNLMRELGRLLIVLKQTTAANNLMEVLKPEYFDNLVVATKVISGYDSDSKSFKSASLALHMGTRLKQVCNLARKLVIKKSRFLHCENPEKTLKDINRLKELISDHWYTDISSLALKDLNEKHWQKPKLYPLTSDIIKFQKYALEEAQKASYLMADAKDMKNQFRKLTECVLSLVLLLNRKRIGEIQYLKLSTYNSDISHYQQEEFVDSLSDAEKILTKNFKRVVTAGKGSKPVAILFPKKYQDLIDIMLNYREKCVPETNGYLFANPRSDNRWLSGYHTLKKLANEAEVQDPVLFTSTRLRKQISTILQVMNMTESEIEQFASFMGHTKKTHEAYYRLPQDIYQTAKVSKLLLAMSKGQASQFKGKSLDEIEFSDSVTSDYPEDEDSTKNEGKEGNSNETENEPSTSEIKVKNNKKKRMKWSTNQKEVMTEYFAEYIRKKIAPKKK
nr:uncharacterized protein LOC111516220 [Leptinotarsa decemlineata]